MSGVLKSADRSICIPRILVIAEKVVSLSLTVFHPSNMNSACRLRMNKLKTLEALPKDWLRDCKHGVSDRICLPADIQRANASIFGEKDHASKEIWKVYCSKDEHDGSEHWKTLATFNVQHECFPLSAWLLAAEHTSKFGPNTRQKLLIGLIAVSLSGCTFDVFIGIETAFLGSDFLFA